MVTSVSTRRQNKMLSARPKSPFEFTGGNPCLDFADTVDNRTSNHPQELLTDYGRLLQWAEEARVISAKTAERLRHLASHEPGQALATLRTSVKLRDAIYLIFSAVAQRQMVPSTALANLNKAVGQAAQHSRLVYASRRFTWEWIDPGSNLDSMLWPVSQAAAELLSGEDIGYVRQCASEDCSWLFLDKTKNHRRRWCDMKSCGNRDKARRYYQRQKAG
jgi:predicted RNA-binding Zn ribbon-like protein